MIRGKNLPTPGDNFFEFMQTRERKNYRQMLNLALKLQKRKAVTAKKAASPLIEKQRGLLYARIALLKTGNPEFARVIAARGPKQNANVANPLANWALKKAGSAAGARKLLEQLSVKYAKSPKPAVRRAELEETAKSMNLSERQTRQMLFEINNSISTGHSLVEAWLYSAVRELGGQSAASKDHFFGKALH